jgi:ribose transport system ATP-binding protein
MLIASGVCKSFGATVALDEARVTLRPGEIHALMGENGSGKSTLLSILGGVQRPDSARIILRGQHLERLTPSVARGFGIAVVNQEPQISPALSVAENILMGKLPGPRGVVRWAEVYARARDVLDVLALDIDPKVPVSSLSLGRRQMIEIAKGLAGQPDILLLDEATSALDDADSRTLFALLRGLKARGVAIAFVSHRMTEVMELADRVTVLRDGKYIGETAIADTDERSLVAMMVGRDLKSYWHKAEVTPGAEVLRLDGVSRGALKNIDMTLHAGEIVGLAGLVGSGRSALLRTLAGVKRHGKGQILLRGKATDIRSPRHARRLGIGYVPEDRKAEGLVMPWSLLKNASLARMSRANLFTLINDAFDRGAYTDGSNGLRVKTSNPRQSVRELSGGNQQKIVIARELATDPQILLLDEPTRGVDVGAKEDIYAEISKLVRDGMALVIASSELQELLGVCDRILVMFRGSIVAEISASQATEETLAYWASGAHEISKQPQLEN